MGELSCGVSLPIGWINYNKLKPGDTLELTTEEDNKAKVAKLVRVEGVTRKTAEKFVEAVPAFL